MSIIERAAELLRSKAQSQPMRSLAEVGHGESGRNLIERASTDLANQSSVSNSGRAPHGPAAQPEARPLTVKARHLKVDPDRLKAQGMITPDGGRTAIAESFRRIKRQILANVDNPKPGMPPANLMMVTSARQGEGKSFCAINLAISMALEVDRSVLLIDADVAKAAVPQAFGLQSEKGLMEVLLDPQIDLAEVMWETDIGRLALLPVGTSHKQATELLASEAMRGLLRRVAERYPDRIVLFDSPPLLAASEAGALASQVGQIVVVVESGRTSESALKDALGRVDTARVAGLVLNKVQGPRLQHGYDTYG